MSSADAGYPSMFDNDHEAGCHCTTDTSGLEKMIKMLAKYVEPHMSDEDQLKYYAYIGDVKKIHTKARELFAKYSKENRLYDAYRIVGTHKGLAFDRAEMSKALADTYEEYLQHEEYAKGHTFQKLTDVLNDNGSLIAEDRIRVEQSFKKSLEKELQKGHKALEEKKLCLNTNPILFINGCMADT
jgi:hypothetical protein